MPKPVSILIWLTVATAGVAALAYLAIARQEHINAVWVLTAALCTFAIGYRFYSKFIANRVFGLSAFNETPACVINDGKDFVPTHKWVVFGHHFAAIAGAGPLVGPILQPNSAFSQARSG